MSLYSASGAVKLNTLTTQFNSTQLKKKLKIAQFFANGEVLNIFRTG